MYLICNFKWSLTRITQFTITQKPKVTLISRGYSYLIRRQQQNVVFNRNHTRRKQMTILTFF